MILLGGCAAVVGPARCEVADGARLTLWVSAAAEVSLDGARVAPAATSRGGARYAIAR